MIVYQNRINCFLIEVIGHSTFSMIKNWLENSGSIFFYTHEKLAPLKDEECCSCIVSSVKYVSLQDILIPTPVVGIIPYNRLTCILRDNPRSSECANKIFEWIIPYHLWDSEKITSIFLHAYLIKVPNKIINICIHFPKKPNNNMLYIVKPT